jgi:hypothetical protein
MSPRKKSAFLSDTVKTADYSFDAITANWAIERKGRKGGSLASIYDHLLV